MSNIIRATVSIRGTRPLLWHHFGPDAIPADGQRKEREGVAGNDPGEWKKTVLVNKNGELYIEPSYVFGMCRDAAKYTKKGKGSIQSAVCATLQVEDNRILICRDGEPLCLPEKPDTDPDLSVYLYICSVKNPSTKARNVRYRIAASVGWEASFTLLWDKTIVSRGEMQAVLNDGGPLVGLADGRSVGFGRFVVESFVVLGD